MPLLALGASHSAEQNRSKLSIWTGSKPSLTVNQVGGGGACTGKRERETENFHEWLRGKKGKFY